MRFCKRIFISALFVLAPVLSAYASSDDNNLLWQEVNRGNVVVIMRHAIAPGMGDPYEFDVNDCSTQRNLSDEGRAQARRIGEVLRSHGVANVQLLSSQWCRCMETAELLDIGTPEPAPMLNSFFRDRSTEPEQTAQTKKALQNWKQENTATVLVTHQVNISALTGQFTSSGEMLLISINEGNVEVLASIKTE